jgi:hypothetical protein
VFKTVTPSKPVLLPRAIISNCSFSFGEKRKNFLGVIVYFSSFYSSNKELVNKKRGGSIIDSAMCHSHPSQCENWRCSDSSQEEVRGGWKMIM